MARRSPAPARRRRHHAISCLAAYCFSDAKHFAKNADGASRKIERARCPGPIVGIVLPVRSKPEFPPIRVDRRRSRIALIQTPNETGSRQARAWRLLCSSRDRCSRPARIGYLFATVCGAGPPPRIRPAANLLASGPPRGGLAAASHGKSEKAEK